MGISDRLDTGFEVVFWVRDVGNRGKMLVITGICELVDPAIFCDDGCSELVGLHWGSCDMPRFTGGSLRFAVLLSSVSCLCEGSMVGHVP